MLDNTYNSYGLRCTRLTDINGKHIKEDTLFLNIYDYWTHFHNPNQIKFTFGGTMNFCQSWKETFEGSGKNIYPLLRFYLRRLKLTMCNLIQQIF